MNKLLQVLLLSLVVNVGFAGCSKKVEEAEALSAGKAKEAVEEMKAKTIDAAKDAAARTVDAAKESEAATEAAVWNAQELAVDDVPAANDSTVKK